jgi:hypothetical protein
MKRGTGAAGARIGATRAVARVARIVGFQGLAFLQPLMEGRQRFEAPAQRAARGHVQWAAAVVGALGHADPAQRRLGPQRG